MRFRQTMKPDLFSNKLFIPDGTPEPDALQRITHLGIGAHQDDLEFMAFHGILACFAREDHWFGGVTCTNGAGSSRTGPYADFTDEQMMAIRRRGTEHRRRHRWLCRDVPARLSQQRGEKPDRSGAEKRSDGNPHRHPAGSRLHPQPRRQARHPHRRDRRRACRRCANCRATSGPKQVIGCEVWRDLDWLPDDDKVLMDVSGRDNLAAALNGVFDSQIAGGKRYDLATLGRRAANCHLLRLPRHGRRHPARLRPRPHPAGGGRVAWTSSTMSAASSTNSRPTSAANSANDSGHPDGNHHPTHARGRHRRRRAHHRPPAARKARRRARPRHRQHAAAALSRCSSHEARLEPVTTFNLDEYIGLPREHPQSYHSFMWENLFRHVNIRAGEHPHPGRQRDGHPGVLRRLRGTTSAPPAASTCRCSASAPTATSASTSRPRRWPRAPASRRSPRRRAATTPASSAARTQVPLHVITMGIGTIMEARQNLLLAFGENKADAVAGTVEGPITAINPASILQMHPVAKVCLDEPAACRAPAGGLLPLGL